MVALPDPQGLRDPMRDGDLPLCPDANRFFQRCFGLWHRASPIVGFSYFPTIASRERIRRAETGLYAVGCPALEDFDVDVDERDGGGGNARDAGSLTERQGADLGEFFHDLARKAGDFSVIKRPRDAARLGALHPFHVPLLLGQVAFVLEIGLDAPGFFALE